jgi:hypothetical protein
VFGLVVAVCFGVTFGCILLVCGQSHIGSFQRCECCNVESGDVFGFVGLCVSLRMFLPVGCILFFSST